MRYEITTYARDGRGTYIRTLYVYGFINSITGNPTYTAALKHPSPYVSAPDPDTSKHFTGSDSGDCPANGILADDAASTSLFAHCVDLLSLPGATPPDDYQLNALYGYLSALQHATHDDMPCPPSLHMPIHADNKHYRSNPNA